MKETNPFKRLETQKEPPEDIKKEVIKEIDSVKLIMEMGELFTSNYASVLESLFKSKK